MNLKNIAGLLGMLLLLNGCYPSDEIYISDLNIVVTHRDGETDFTQLKTYKLDTVVYDPEGDYRGKFNAVIMDQIRFNMAELGYTELTDATVPDIYVQPAIILQDWIVSGGGGCYYYCGGWWGGGYYPPYYPGWVASYSTGTILITMKDSNEETPTAPNAIWMAGINGLVGQNLTNDQIGGYIDTAFTQSAYYLKTN